MAKVREEVEDVRCPDKMTYGEETKKRTNPKVQGSLITSLSVIPQARPYCTKLKKVSKV